MNFAHYQSKREFRSLSQSLPRYVCCYMWWTNCETRTSCIRSHDDYFPENQRRYYPVDRRIGTESSVQGMNDLSPYTTEKQLTQTIPERPPFVPRLLPSFPPQTRLPLLLLRPTCLMEGSSSPLLTQSLDLCLPRPPRGAWGDCTTVYTRQCCEGGAR